MRRKVGEKKTSECCHVVTDVYNGICLKSLKCLKFLFEFLIFCSMCLLLFLCFY